MYFSREAQLSLQKLQKGFPIIVITGPRQAGKTTFLQHNFPDFKYYNLEDLQVLQSIKDDPKKFLLLNPENIILDEVQRFPEILSYLQVHVDQHQKMGSILLSGSQNLLISEKISQSLAGRAAYQTISPFSLAEKKQNNILDQGIFKNILKGGYPALYTREISPELYFRQYISTYIERDVRQIRNIGDLTLFQKFMTLLAGRVGQLLNASSLANDLDVSSHTIEDWISILEASYIVFRLTPFHKNIGKRLIKSPKIYFHDTGLLCALLSIRNEIELNQHFAYGGIVENFIISEIKKNLNNQLKNSQLSFYRDSKGNEIDLLIEEGGQLKAVEIKANMSYKTDFLKGLKQADQLSKNVKKYLIYAGDLKTSVHDVEIFPWSVIAENPPSMQ